MKNIAIIALSAITLASCNGRRMVVEVSNRSDAAFENATVELAWADVAARLPAAEPSKIKVVDVKSGDELARQIVYLGEQTPQMLIFQITLAPGESKRLAINEGKPAQAVTRTFGRFVPERKDDFAWENDRIAFRMYGPALADENPSNGVDMWLKKTEKPIIDRFYNDDKKGKSYHADHGEGLDCYKVGRELGAGGIAPFVNDTLWVGGHYVTQTVLDNGPLRTTFRLAYNNLPVGSKIYSEEITVSLDAGSQLNKAVVSFDGDFTEIKLAAGISLHRDGGVTRTDIAAGYNAFGEAAVSDAGAPAGRSYVATVIPDGKMLGSLMMQNHLLAIASLKKGDRFTYYFGGGWSQWGFKTDNAWFEYVAAFADRLKKPLTVTVK